MALVKPRGASTGRRRTAIVALATVFTVTLTGSSCQSSSKTPDDPHDSVSYPDIPAAPTGSTDPANRQAIAPVPKGTTPKAIEFADADTGYALFQSCTVGRSCDVGLVLTLDGGLSWVSRDLPFTGANSVDLKLGRGNVLMLRADPIGWYVSRDNGRTFQQRPLNPPPVELNLVGPQFAVGCLDGGTDCQPKQLMEVGADGALKVLPGRPAGGGQFTSLVAQQDGRLWLSVQHSDAQAAPPVNAVTVLTSVDRGKTWTSTGSVNLFQPDLQPHLAVLPEGGDLWLVGDRYAAERRSDGTWAEATTMREITKVLSVQVLPGGELMVSSVQGLWMVDLQERANGDDRLKTAFSLRRVNATTIQAYPGQVTGEVWLCTVTNKTCDWIRVAVSTP